MSAQTDLRNGHAPQEYPRSGRRYAGQEHAKRALEIAAAGGHNVLAFSSEHPHHVPHQFGQAARDVEAFGRVRQPSV